MTLEVPLRLPHATPLAGPHPPASLTALERATERARAFAAQAVEQLRPSEGWKQRLAALRLFTRTALQPAADRHTEAQGDRGDRLPRMAQAAWHGDFFGSG